MYNLKLRKLKRNIIVCVFVCVCVCMYNGVEGEMTIMKKDIGVYNQEVLPNLDCQAILN